MGYYPELVVHNVCLVWLAYQHHWVPLYRATQSSSQITGLFDVLADGPEQLISASTDFLAKLKADGFPVCKTCDLTVSQDGLPGDIFEQTEAGLKKKAAGFYAPFKCLEAVKNSLSMDFQTALKAEQALFMGA